MTKASLYASHRKFRDLFFDHYVFGIYAYVPGNHMAAISPKWKIKTSRFNSNILKNSIQQLKSRDASGKMHPIVFDFGWQKREHLPGIKDPVYLLEYNYELEREALEHMCKLSDEGHDIIANGCVVLEASKGYQILVDIDLEAPSYAYLDEPIEVPF